MERCKDHTEQDDDQDYSDDDEPITPIRSYLSQDSVFTFKVDLLSYDIDSCKEVRGSILKQKKLVGELTGYLVQREPGFYQSCDAISAELQLISNQLFHQNGRLRRDVWERVLDNNCFRLADVGTLLSIDSIHVYATVLQ